MSPQEIAESFRSLSKQQISQLSPIRKVKFFQATGVIFMGSLPCTVVSKKKGPLIGGPR